MIGELLLMLRGVPEANAKRTAGCGTSRRSAASKRVVKKLGIIGYGHIGTQLGILAESLGMHVFFYDIEKTNCRSATPLRYSISPTC